MPRFRPSVLDPRRMIATATLQTVHAILRGSGGHRLAAGATASVGPVTVSVPEHPILSRIGGVARVDPGPGGPVGIARVSHSGFVAFELGPDGLAELPVEVDASLSTLRVHRAHTASPTLHGETGAAP